MANTIDTTFNSDSDNIDIFEDYKLKGKRFNNPLENICFRYYLDNYVDNIDHDKLYNDPSYLKLLYYKYLNHLVDRVQKFRPNFPPNIDVERYVNENENNSKIKDMSKMNGGNAFMVYRKHLIKHLEKIGESIPMQQLSSIAGSLWKSEPQNVKDWYKVLSDEIKKLHNERLKNCINNKRKRSSEDNIDEKISSKKIRDMTKKNGGNSFIIFRTQLYEILKSSGYNHSMQQHSSLASFMWSKQPPHVKSQFKESSEKTKKMLNHQLKNLFCKSENENNEPVVENNNKDPLPIDWSCLKSDIDMLANDAHDNCNNSWMGESKIYYYNGSLTNDNNNINFYLKSDAEFEGEEDHCNNPWMGESKQYYYNGSLTNDDNDYLEEFGEE
jgi:hypothetical protein